MVVYQCPNKQMFINDMCVCVCVCGRIGVGVFVSVIEHITGGFMCVCVCVCTKIGTKMVRGRIHSFSLPRFFTFPN